MALPGYQHDAGYKIHDSSSRSSSAYKKGKGWAFTCDRGCKRCGIWRVWGRGIAYDRHALNYWFCSFDSLTLPLKNVPKQRIIYFLSLLMPCALAYACHRSGSSFCHTLCAKVVHVPKSYSHWWNI